jgi:hypothetical protein
MVARLRLTGSVEGNKTFVLLNDSAGAVVRRCGVRGCCQGSQADDGRGELHCCGRLIGRCLNE